MLGTKWVAPGKGNTVKELLIAIFTRNTESNWTEAERHLTSNNRSFGSPTNIMLTGERVTNYDLRRIAVCEIGDGE